MSTDVLAVGSIGDVDPALILADDNSRFGLKETRIETMMESILNMGGVRTPLKVSPLKTRSNGHLYRLNVGHYRLAASLRLNKEQNAGIMVPIEVEESPDDLVRLKRQISENNDRENLSVMDKAIACRRLLDAGVSKVEVRNIFSTPGGRKGMKNQPASNSMINIMLSFLEFPKKVQDKLHDGSLTVTAGMRLYKAPKEKWEDILKAAEEARLAEIESSEKDEEKFLAEEKKVQEAQDNQAKTVKELEEAEESKNNATEAAQKAQDDLAAAFKAKQTAKAAEDKKRAEEHFKVMEALAKSAEKAADEASKKVGKLQLASEKITKLAQEKKAQLDAARGKAAGKDTSKKGVSEKHISAADAGIVKLNGAEMRAYVQSLTKASNYPKVVSIGHALLACWNGANTPKQTTKRLAILTGEMEDPEAKKAAKA